MMDSLGMLVRLIRIEAHKYWRKPVAKAVLIFMLVAPIGAEVLLAKFSPVDAIFPRVTQFLFSPDLCLIIALITVVLSVMALGDDYELGTVRVIISQGVDRHQYILSKIIATVGAALFFGFVFECAALISTFIVHITSSDAPFIEAAGESIVWRVLGTVGVIGLVNFVLSGIVMMGLVLGRSSWVGMLTGLGYFFGDFFIGALGSGSVLGVDTAYRFTITYRAISMIERFFPSDPGVSLPRQWIAGGFADPRRAGMVLFLYGVGLTVVSIYLFHHRDLTTEN
jgi:ABC-type transport system involved in multi-copper enzyme maturation permease subunit